MWSICGGFFTAFLRGYLMYETRTAITIRKGQNPNLMPAAKTGNSAGDMTPVVITSYPSRAPVDKKRHIKTHINLI